MLERHFVGIDVTQAALEVALRLVLMVLEATGGLEVPLTSALAAGLVVVEVNPSQARDFAKAIGQLAKPDALGAGRWPCGAGRASCPPPHQVKLLDLRAALHPCG